MGLFDFLLGRDITRDWVADPVLKLEFNFDGFSLNGVRLGDRVDELNELGPAEDRGYARKGVLRYYSWGLLIETVNELIETFVLIWEDVLDPRFLPFAGACTLNGEVLRLHRESTFLDVIAAFGEPHERDGTDLFVYNHPSVLMEVEFDELDLLSMIILMPHD